MTNKTSQYIALPLKEKYIYENGRLLSLLLYIKLHSIAIESTTFKSYPI